METKKTGVLKTPITYYGGKQMMVKHLLPLIPEHKIYNEPFFGGGALFFSKQPAEIEFINDISGEVVNFYRVIKRRFNDLKNEIDCTLNSEYQFKQAKEIYNNSNGKDEVLRAWSVYVLSHQSMFASFDKGWKMSRERNQARQFQNKKEQFTEVYVKRLENTSIFCRDALKVIKATDTGATFHYIDPPYYNSNCGHYGGYSIDDYKNLLDTLSQIKGSFILSSYPSAILSEYAAKCGWRHKEIEMNICVGFGSSRKKEVITTNYDCG